MPRRFVCCLSIGSSKLTLPGIAAVIFICEINLGSTPEVAWNDSHTDRTNFKAAIARPVEPLASAPERARLVEELVQDVLP